MTPTEARALIAAGWTHVVIVDYDHQQYVRGDMISKHRSHKAAEKAASRYSGDFRSVRDLRDIAYA